MITFALDCSQNNLTLALLKNTQIIHSLHELECQASQNLLKKIDELFEQTDLKITGVDQILYGIGPGSFTSLRIGYATILGLFGNLQDLKVYGVSSLLLRLLSLDENENQTTAIAFPARKNKIYVGWFENKQFQESCLSMDDWQTQSQILKLTTRLESSKTDVVKPLAFQKILENSKSYQSFLKSQIQLNYLQPQNDIATRSA